jgi:predicted transcriptional regulator
MNTMKQPVNFRLEDDKVAALDRLAKSLDRDRSYLLTEAVNSYLELHEWQIEQIQEGIREADAGRLIDHDVVVKRMSKKMQKRRRHG